MSFVTFSQRSKSVFGSAMARQRTHRTSTVATDSTLAVMQEMLIFHSKEIMYIRGRDHKKQSPFERPTLIDQRLFRRYAVKIGLKGPIRKTDTIFGGIFRAVKHRTSGRLLAFNGWKGGVLHLSVKLVEKSTFGLQPDPGCIPKVYADAYTSNADLEFVNIMSPETRFTEPSGQSEPRDIPSISFRRLGSNIPALQRHTVFSLSQYASPNGKADTRPWEYFLRSPCPTPITPLDKILRTPPYPPSLQRPDMRKSLSTTAARTPESLATFSQSSKYSVSNKAICKVSENIRRRLSIVAPPDAMPIHAPRRLSYSHTCGKPRSPLRRRNVPTSSENLDSSAESDLLASPLVILPSSSYKQYVGWTDNGGHTPGISFLSIASPLRSRV
ncbi:hypothetical protein HYPSUDRAFT_35312 [Hypholoma sublateritium FD-334 SS-4]|uniref:Uncharacterized protein n=1 Tax=Hypholoma sublateritium (strain FD-334 SS-4) TaxID=945553 RepID=A0A0D2MTT0_HYPSF|nr:hypothetical protein HYPSUDRAFT_35312 [Hypholoma sublateritium FD-334 SS-4]